MATTKEYCVVYLSAGGMHYRFKCCAENKRQARRYCHDCMGVRYADITDCYEEGEYRG